MKVEELLQTLRDGGMDDEAIKKLLSEAIAALEPAPEMEKPAGDGAKEESEEEKMNRVFGL